MGFSPENQMIDGIMELRAALISLGVEPNEFRIVIDDAKWNRFKSKMEMHVSRMGIEPMGELATLQVAGVEIGPRPERRESDVILALRSKLDGLHRVKSALVTIGQAMRDEL